MNRFIFFFFFSLFSFLQADQTQETFLKAGAYYEKGKVTEALELYKKISLPYPSVLYNSGLCYYALGQYAQALVAFKKAERLGTRQLFNKASQAIALTQKKLGVPEDPSFFNISWLIHTFLPGDGVRFLFLLVLALFSLIVALGRSTVRLTVAAITFLLMTGTCCAYDYWFSCQRYGIVLSKDAFVYAGPDKQFHKVSEIRVGQQVKVVEHQQSWYKVYFLGGQGWVQETDLGVF